MYDKDTLKGMSMSQIIDAYNELATRASKPTVTEFKSLNFARQQLSELETKMNTEAPFEADAPAATTAATGETTAAAPVKVKSADAAKYDSTGKRGPNQGVGAHAKALLLTGATNDVVLASVQATFPNAKTSKGCIAFYRAALQRDGKLGKGGVVIAQNPADMIAAAEATIAKAQEAIAAARALAETQAAEAAAKAAEVPATV